MVFTAAMLSLAILLVCLNGFFVAAEFSFVKVRKTQLELLAAMGDKRAKNALFGVTHLDAYLSVCQLGITLASLGLGWLGEPAVARVLYPVLEFFSISNPALLASLSFAVGFSIITLLHVVFGELIPKTVSIQKAESAVLLLALPMRVFYVLCLPLVTVMNGVSNFFLRLASMPAAGEEGHAYSPEELRMLILDSSKRGSLGKDEGRMLDNIFSFYHKTAKSIMVHRTDVLALDVESPREEALALADKTGHTRFPVYEGNRDNITGFVHLRDILRDKGPIKAVVRAPFYASESLHLDRLLLQMQENKQQLCVVLDEYGVWQGILTMEDIVEAIVGNIQDEFDNERLDIIKEADGAYSISGQVSLDDLAEFTHIDYFGMDIDPYRNIAAHFVEELGRIPRTGDAITLCGKRFTVTHARRNRIERVRVEDAPPDA